MIDFITECKNMVLHVQKLLEVNKEWVPRYEKYADKIITNILEIKNLKNKFHEWAPLFLYMNVTQAKSRMEFSLRYLGQDVAKIKASKDRITTSTKGFNEKNKKYFGCIVELENNEWDSAAAANFRNHFSKHPKRIDDLSKKNEEHRIESMLLTQFAKKKSKDKILCNIQPVKIAGIARFQMPTPINASDVNNIKYTGSSGGGIDILSRIGKGASTKLCIMELKDEYTTKEPPAKVVLQGLAYATFIRELLRSDSGQEWWKIFGFGGILPQQIELYVACIMPFIYNYDKFFANEIIKIGNDSFHLNYIYFQEVIRFAKLETSLKQCTVKTNR